MLAPGVVGPSPAARTTPIQGSRAIQSALHILRGARNEIVTTENHADFLTQILHQPLGLMSPLTSLQALGAINRLQPSH